MRLTAKITLIVVFIVTVIITTIFLGLTWRFENQQKEDMLFTARTVFNHVVMVRQWVSSKGGVYVFKGDTEKSNPYLKNPDIITQEGDTLTLKNPALVTRELSEISKLNGKDYAFHMASNKYINPLNKPDDFEKKALQYFENHSRETASHEFYEIQKIEGRSYFRYFAPLYIEASCLKCHKEQGYKLGDLRGGISVILPMEQFEKSRKANFVFFTISALLTISILSGAIYIAFRKTIIHPLQTIENSLRRIQKKDYNFQLNLPQKDEIGKLAKTLDIMREQIKSYTQQLQQSEEKHRKLIEYSPEAMAIIREDGAIFECNNNLKRLTGFSENQLKSKNFFKLIDIHRIKPISSILSQVPEVEHFETILHTKERFHIPVEVYLIKNLSLDGEDNLIFAYVWDLSERKKIEQYAIQAEKMFALGQLSSGIAHEVRNPLFALENNIEYLNGKFQDAAAFRDVYPELKDSIDRIHRIVASILDYARPHEPAFVPMDIQEVIEKCLVLVHKQFEKSKIRINTRFSHGHLKIEADPHQLEQMFVNLFLNAFQAMGEEGDLTIETGQVENELVVKITDTGCGIAPDDIPRIFDPFFTKSQNGTGLGLAIVKRILDQHGARCRIESTLNTGTSFIIHFSILQEAKA